MAHCSDIYWLKQSSVLFMAGQILKVIIPDLIFTNDGFLATCTVCCVPIWHSQLQAIVQQLMATFSTVSTQSLSLLFNKGLVFHFLQGFKCHSASRKLPWDIRGSGMAIHHLVSTSNVSCRGHDWLMVKLKLLKKLLILHKIPPAYNNI